MSDALRRPFFERVGSFVSSGHRPLIILLLTGLIVGVWLGRDYGMSTDEERNAGVGADALSAFSGDPSYFDRPSLDEHGPAYFMLFSATSRAIASGWPGWTLPDGRHLTNYAMFLVAVAAYYFLSLRLVRREMAWLATALFATQPLLFGHAFINQKDIPFLALFLATLATGLAAIDASVHVCEAKTVGGRESIPAQDEQPKPSMVQRTFLAVVVLAAAWLLVDLLVLGRIRDLTWTTIVAAYHGHAPFPIQQLFNSVATDAYKTPLALYRAKFGVAWFAVQLVLAPAVIVGALAASGRTYPRAADAWGWSFRRARRFRLNWWLIASAALLGLTICVRQLGIFAGVLVTAYAIYRGRAHALVPLAVFWIVAGVTTVITWPYLWPNPPARFLESLYLAAHFPETHVTLFRGQWLQAGEYPWSFFPTLVGIELTEPMAILIAAGMALAVKRIANRSPRGPFLVLLGLWAAVPLAGLILFGLTTYGNITHLLFVLPPFLLLASLALEAILSRLSRHWMRVVLAGASLLPGVWGIISLHPYEYIYINSYAGGVGGAYNYYELDRACISLREAIEYVNQTAPVSATVMLPSGFHQVIPFARPDLNLVDNRTSYAAADYVVSCSWVHGLGPWPSEDFHLIHEIQRGGAILTEIWQRRAGGA